ncbi:MAG TPA: hypothetical protein PLX89_09860 [Verrucomicrobiota bacterium]|nr:hypothetical protein [Verrucomicrobiales bacterium]HRI13301.1 hypothetical protein [Verrucomicrobiota bacterium]
MPAIDFTTALARLLRDGRLRDEFAADPKAVTAQMELAERDSLTLQALDPTDLEFQAQVLLRKRFDVVRRLIPQTCRHLSDQAWPSFAQYARGHWPNSGDAAEIDAQAFCSHLQSVYSDRVSPLEWNRLRFALSKKLLAVHLLGRNATQTRTALQILIRILPTRWHEFLLYPRL